MVNSTSGLERAGGELSFCLSPLTGQRGAQTGVSPSALPRVLAKRSALGPAPRCGEHQPCGRVWSLQLDVWVQTQLCSLGSSLASGSQVPNLENKVELAPPLLPPPGRRWGLNS